MRVLILEDKRKFAEAICTGLEESGYTAKVVDTREASLRRLCNEPLDQMPLDGIPPCANGLEALRTARVPP
jgi:DNA-binding response OmpR family regulator